ncbi:MAG: sulfate adenylyltransferase [Acidobacteria bacterium]|nr:sulfate adenylyltransferase [Acidobacteriota bacterium]MBI3426896.1 sulfate adenylyltransferase [Acidobacteriota bacterium]
MSLIQPHGGTLVDRKVTGQAREEWLRRAKGLPRVTLNARNEADLELLANGAFSPLEGFLNEADYLRVRDERRLASGLVWSIPVTLAVDGATRKSLRTGTDIALYARDGRLLAILHLEEIYGYNKELEAAAVYKTTDAKHPGVAAVYEQGEFLLGGKISLLEEVNPATFAQYRLSPRQTRDLFTARNWQRIVAFQTRNPVHRAHEYIQKSALEIVDGLLLHPIVGETKSDDIPAEVRVKAYEVLLAGYYPQDRVQLAVLPAAMRYAGPREAIFHALIRQNYGCSHFIVGRDHAGVGNYYGTYEAQQAFGDFAPGEIGITTLFFDNTFFCRRCDGMASLKTCPHDAAEHVSLSGTKVRELLAAGEIPPVEFTRAEVAQVLIEGLKAQALKASA